MTEATQPDPPTSSQLADFWQALNGPEGKPVTEATQPDPQVEPTDLGSQVRGRLGQGVGAIFIRTRHREDPWLSLRTGRRGRWDELNDIKILESGEGIDSVFLEAEVCDQITPLTVADIPAGEGAASLYLAQYHRRLVLWFKADDATHHFIRMEPGPEGLPHDRALWEHLTATVPRITKKESP